MGVLRFVLLKPLRQTLPLPNINFQKMRAAANQQCRLRNWPSIVSSNAAATYLSRAMQKRVQRSAKPESIETAPSSAAAFHFLPNRALKAFGCYLLYDRVIP